MKFITINLVDLFNVSMQEALVRPLMYAREGLVDKNEVTAEDLDEYIKSKLDKLEQMGFKKNTKFLIVNGGCPAMNPCVDMKYHGNCQGMHMPLVISGGAREFLLEYNISVPISIELSHVYTRIRRLLLESYDYITLVEFEVDYLTSVFALREASVVDIEAATMEELLGANTWNADVVISPYEFYLNTFRTPVVMEMTDKIRRLLKTKADQTISQVMC